MRLAVTPCVNLFAQVLVQKIVVNNQFFLEPALFKRDLHTVLPSLLSIVGSEKNQWNCKPPVRFRANTTQ